MRNQIHGWIKLGIGAALARWSWGDIAISLSGIGLAISSAAFATIMIAQSGQGGRLQPSEHLAIFSRPVSQPYAGGQMPAYDPMPVGSVRVRVRGEATGSIPQEKIASTYRLRSFSQGEALVQGPEGFITVRPGSMIEGLGEVLAIEFRGRRIVIVTTGGLVLEEE